VVTNDEAGYGWTTYPERLEEAGVSWKIYQDTGDGLDAAGSWGWTADPYIGNYGDNSLLYFDNYRNALPGSPLHEKARTGTSGGHFFAPLRNDVLDGKLPQVSWIVAPQAYTEHPNWPANYGAWYVREPNISPWRRAVCGDLTAAFDFRRAHPAPPTLPDTSAYRPAGRLRHPDYVPAPPADPALPRQEPGTRPARPLPYDLTAEARVTGAGVTVTFASRGRAGATFHTTVAGGEPRTFTAAARTHLSGTWPAGSDVTVHGPDGFLRRFRSPGVEVTTRQDRLTLANPSGRTARVVLTDSYGGPRTVIRLNPGQSQVHCLPLCAGRYDVTVTSDVEPGYLRRLAGHVEG
jgi:hypothetical protein